MKRRESLQHAEAVQLRQAGVQKHEVEPVPRKQVQRLYAALGDQGVKAPAFHARRDPAGRSLIEHSDQKPHERTSRS